MRLAERTERGGDTLIGPQYEGRLRKHAVLPDGYVRNTLMFRVTDEEWPKVRDGLERRLKG